MTAHILLNGTLHKTAETRVSKNGRDDAQVVNLTVQKVYGVIAGVTVTAMRLDDEGGADA